MFCLDGVIDIDKFVIDVKVLCKMSGKGFDVILFCCMVVGSEIGYVVFLGEMNGLF